MKKLLIIISLMFSITFLSGCEKEEVYIAPDEISVVFENLRYEGTSLYVDVFITNGLESNEFVGYMEFDIYSYDDEVYIAGAGFDIDASIPSNDYVTIELEFGYEFVYYSESELNTAGYEIEDSALYFYAE